MSGVSIGAVTDYLYGRAQAAVVGVVVNGEAALAVDGEPDAVSFGMFVVGMNEPPPDGTGVTDAIREWDGLGAQRIREDYTIPCYIDVRVPGNKQKPARDAAEAMFNTFWASISVDKTLGGLLTGGYFAELDALAYHPSNVGTVAEPGRRQLVTFGVHCRNVTT